MIKNKGLFFLNSTKYLVLVTEDQYVCSEVETKLLKII